MKKKKVLNGVWFISMALVSLMVLLPIVMMISTSFKTAGEINSAGFHFLPETFRLDNYKEALTTGDWGIYCLYNGVKTLAFRRNL